MLGMGNNTENRDYIKQGEDLEHVTQEKDAGERGSGVNRQGNVRQL